MRSNERFKRLSELLEASGPGSTWYVERDDSQLSRLLAESLREPQRVVAEDGKAVLVVSEDDVRRWLAAGIGEVDIVDLFRAEAIPGAPLRSADPGPVEPAPLLAPAADEIQG